LDAVADLMADVLAQSTSVKILATSREGLGVADEQVWPVRSLDVETAADLFADRAHDVAPHVTLDQAAVVDICGRLDGIPLAIELAASRMASMTAGEVRDRLDDRFKLLVGSRRDWSVTKRCVMQWHGPTSFSMTQRRHCWIGVRCLRADSISEVPAR
jgi:predicted ATPase